jgi:hypothetical protein
MRTPTKSNKNLSLSHEDLEEIEKGVSLREEHEMNSGLSRPGWSDRWVCAVRPPQRPGLAHWASHKEGQAGRLGRWLGISAQGHRENRETFLISRNNFIKSKPI